MSEQDNPTQLSLIEPQYLDRIDDALDEQSIGQILEYQEQFVGFSSLHALLSMPVPCSIRNQLGPKYDLLEQPYQFPTAFREASEQDELTLMLNQLPQTPERDTALHVRHYALYGKFLLEQPS